MIQLLDIFEKQPFRRQLGMVALFAAIVMFAGLGAREIWSGDETRCAGIGAEMAFSGDWMVPRLNGEPFLEYPSLFYWIEAAAFKIFGFQDFAAKLPSALAGFGSTVLIFCLARILAFSAGTGLFAAVMQATGAQFFMNSRTCMVDALLAFCVLTAMTGGTMFRLRHHPKSGLALLSAGICGGIMTKGLIGAVIPAAVLGIWLATDDAVNRKFRWQDYLAFLLAGIAALLPVCLWLRGLYCAAGADAVHEVVMVNNFGRFSGSQGDHVVPWHYYLEKLPGQFQPYLIFLFFGIWLAVRDWRRNKNSGILLLLLFLFVPYFLLTLSASKRQVYLLPLYAPAALLAARFLEALLRGSFPVVRRRWIDRIACAVGRGFPAMAVIAGIAALAAGTSATAPVLMILTGGAALLLAGKKRTGYAAVCGVFCYGALFAAIESSVMSTQNAKESLRALFAETRKKLDSGEKVCITTIERTRGGAAFYLQRTLPVFSAAIPVEPDAWVICRDRNERKNALPFADHHYLEYGAEWNQKQTSGGRK